MRYGVIGPRDFGGKVYDNYDHIAKYMNSWPDIDELILGGSRGVEKLVEKWAVEKGIPFRLVRPNTKIVAAMREAFDTRNLDIISQAQAMIIFWDGETASMVPVLARCMKCKREVSLGWLE